MWCRGVYLPHSVVRGCAGRARWLLGNLDRTEREASSAAQCGHWASGRGPIQASMGTIMRGGEGEGGGDLVLTHDQVGAQITVRERAGWFAFVVGRQGTDTEVGLAF